MKILLIILVLILFVVIVGCEKNDPVAVQPEKPSRLLGLWVAPMDGYQVSLSIQSESASTFDGVGTFQMASWAIPLTIKGTVNGDQVVFSVQNIFGEYWGKFEGKLSSPVTVDGYLESDFFSTEITFNKKG